nr:uncharacterized protein LOC108064265 [Drosophila takahashii]
MSRKRLNDDPPQGSPRKKWRELCQDYRFQNTETYPSIRTGEPRCNPNQDEAIAGLANSLAADDCGRPFDMVKDDVLLAWQQSPHKDTLGFYGVGSPTHQPESVVFNRVLAACLVKVSCGGSRRRRPKKTRSPPPRTGAAGNIFKPQLCNPLILNRKALQSELRKMPYVKQQLEPLRAFETVYCPDPTDPSDPFGVLRQKDEIRPKNTTKGKRRRHWYCPMDCDEVRNKCTQYEWTRYKLDPRPRNKEFRDWLQEQRELRCPEPKDYDQLYERFLKCFEQKPSPDPLCKIFQKCCKPKTPQENDNQGGGDGHEGNGDGRQGGGPSSDQGKSGGGETPTKGEENGEKGTGEEAGGTADSKDTRDGRENKNRIEEESEIKKVESEIREEESNTKEKDIPKRNTPRERFSEREKPSVKTDTPLVPLEKDNERPSNRETSVTHSITEIPVQEYDRFEPIFPKGRLKVPHKRKKKFKNKTVGMDKIKKICQPCPPPGCQCDICHFMDRHCREPEAPFMRDMRRAEQRRQQRAYYRQMCHQEYLRNQCREEYRAPRHKCDPIRCDNFLCRNPRLAEHCDCLEAVQELQKLLSGAKDNQDCCRLLPRVENLRSRLCQRMCDCVLA